MVLLESEASARARGAMVYAEVAGYGASNDAYHVATPHPASRGVIHMFNDALTSAKVRPEEVGYINAHGTGTPLGDPAETQAIRQAFGAHADELAVSSTKSMTGHLFGAAGALEAIASALALRDQVLPPTINLEDPDPGLRPRLRTPEEPGGPLRRGHLELDGAGRPQWRRRPSPRRLLHNAAKPSPPPGRPVRLPSRSPCPTSFARPCAAPAT